MVARHQVCLAHWRLLHIACIALLVWGTGACQSRPNVPANRWFDHESQSGNFRIQFPHEPIRTRARGDREIRYTVEYDSGRRLLRASYERDLKASDTLESRLAEVVKQPDVVGSVKTSPISLGRYRGLESTYLMRSGTATLRARHRIYQVGSMSYQMLALADKEVDATADFDRFFNSFQILSISEP